MKIESSELKKVLTIALWLMWPIVLVIQFYIIYAYPYYQFEIIKTIFTIAHIFLIFLYPPIGIAVTMILVFFSAYEIWNSFFYGFLFAMPGLLLIIPSSLIVFSRDEKLKRAEKKEFAEKMNKNYGDIKIDISKKKNNTD